MTSRLGDFYIRLLAFGALLVTLVLAYFAIQILLVPFVAALFIVYLFDPGVVALQRRGLDRGNAFLLILLVTSIGAVGFLAFAPAWLRLESITGSSANFTEQLDQQIAELERWAHSRFPMIENIRIAQKVSVQASGFAEHFFEALPGLVTAFAVNLLLAPFIAYFMVRDGKTLKRRVVELLPNRYFEMSLIMCNRVDQQIGGYLRGRLIECMLVGLTQMIFMGAVAVFVPQEQILLISAVCGITNLIPYVGPLLGTMFGVFLYLGAGLPTSAVFGLIIAATLAHLVDNIFIAPAVLSHNVDLHPLSVALVLVIGGELLGIIGLLIAIPVAATIKVIVQEFYANYQLQVR